jgi:hypothetical protein
MFTPQHVEIIVTPLYSLEFFYDDVGIYRLHSAEEKDDS